MNCFWTVYARRFARWLVWAMLLAALAPAVSRTLASTRANGPGGWVELCTAEGLQRVAWPAAASDAGTGRDEVPAHRALDHCGHCLLAAERFAPLIPTWPTLPFEPGTSPAPEKTVWSPAVCPAPQPAARDPPFLI